MSSSDDSNLVESISDSAHRIRRTARSLIAWTIALASVGGIPVFSFLFKTAFSRHPGTLRFDFLLREISSWSCILAIPAAFFGLAWISAYMSWREAHRRHRTSLEVLLNNDRPLFRP